MIYLDLWLFTFGVWPLAHPNHTDGSLMSLLDIGLHLAGLWGVCLWVYRNRERSISDVWHGRKEHQP